MKSTYDYSNQIISFSERKGALRETHAVYKDANYYRYEQYYECCVSRVEFSHKQGVEAAIALLKELAPAQTEAREQYLALLKQVEQLTKEQP